jgi:hypothetical protein
MIRERRSRFRSLDIPLSRPGEDDASHLRIGLVNAILGAEFGIKLVEVLRIAGAPGVDALLYRLPFFVLPVQGVERLADDFHFGSAIAGGGSLLDALHNVLR